MMGNVDVAIIGGGPAGAAAALALLRYTQRRIALVESPLQDGPRTSEVTPAILAPLLRVLDAEELRPGEVPCGATAAWGGPEPMLRHALFSTPGDNMLLDRRAFDEALCELVRARGGQVLRYELRRAERVGGHWLLTLTDEHGEALSLRARYAVDASGRRTSLVRQLGITSRRDDALVSVALRFAAAEPVELDEPATLVEAVPDGWWYTAPLPDGQLLAALMTDAATVRVLRLTERASAVAALSRAPHTRARVRGRAGASPPQVASACSRRLLELTGPGWAATGDAAASFDPLAALSLPHALASGAQVARLADAVLDESPEGASRHEREYAEALERQYQHYLQLRQRYYRLEQRWADRPFWRARHAVEPRRVRVTPAGQGAGSGRGA